ncbi:MAG: DNA primase [Sphingobacteriales bacterium]|nr:MAG: DNA primase [Sphingobacteriales bacterium]
MISPASIQQVLDRADVVDVVGQFVRLKKRGANYIANCPFHNEKTPSFSVSAAKGIYKCFGCGKAGNVVTFVQDHEKLTYPEAIRWLADYYKIQLEETERSPEQQVQHQAEEALRILNEYAAQYFAHVLNETEEGQAIGMSYFKHRGFTKNIIERFRLGYNPESGEALYRDATGKGHTAQLLEKAGLIKEGRNNSYYDIYRGRVIFPIQSMTGRVLGFGARILKSNDRAPKYINTPENELYNKSRVLYGMYQSRQAISKQDECFLVEGYTDVISLHQGGVENVVSSSGTSLTEGQLKIIGQLTKNITILYDGDAAGVKAALRGLDMALGQSFNVQLVLLPEGEDPDSYVQKSGAAKFHEYVKGHKQDVISFRMEVGMKEVGTDPVQKSKLVNEIAESISRINKAEDFALQDHYMRTAINKLNVEEQGFINLVNKYIRERIDKEQRQFRNDEPAPLPDVQVPSQEIYDKPSASDENQEWELVRVLIEHGSKPMEGFNCMAENIQQRVDPDLIETELARQIFDSYFSYVATYQIQPTTAYFTNLPEINIQQKVATLLQGHIDISPKWKENYGIESMAGDMNYVNEVESTLLYFEIKKMKLMQQRLWEMIGEEKDELRLTVIMKKYMEFRQQEADMMRRLGTVVLKSISRR